MFSSLAVLAFIATSCDAYNPNGVRQPTHNARHHIRPTTEFFSTEDLISKPISAKDFDEKAVRSFRRKLENFRDAAEFVGESFGDRMQKRTYKIDSNGWEQQKKATFRRPKLVYYEVLGLDSEASASEIKRSYRQMAKLYHPDANPEKDTTAHFTLLNRAYEVLTNPRLKQRYDRYGGRGIGTSAASDVIHANGIAPTKRKSYPAYQVAISDSADVCWKGAGTSKRVDLQPKQSKQTLFQAMNKNLIPPAAAPIRSRKPMRDLYSILQVQREAKDDEIWHAYNSMKELFDPATNDSKEAYIRHREITRAYEVLKNPEWRSKYDKYGFRALDNIRTMDERVSRPTDMDPDSPYSANSVPHYSLDSVETTGTPESPIVVPPYKAVVATRPSADYDIGSWMTTTLNTDEETSKKVYRIYQQIDPLPIEDTYSFQPARRGPIPIIELYEDDEDWEEVSLSPIILPAASTRSKNELEDDDGDYLFSSDTSPKPIPFPDLSVAGRVISMATPKSSVVSPSAATARLPNLSSLTNDFVASRPSADHQDKANSRITAPLHSTDDKADSKKVYRIYQQIDPLPLDQTYNFKPAARASIPIIEVYVDDDEEGWNDPSSPPILFPAVTTAAGGPTNRASIAAAPKLMSISKSKPQSIATPSSTTRRAPINATPTLMAPKTKGSTLKASTATVFKESILSNTDEPPRWSLYSYTRNSLQCGAVEAIIRNPISNAKVANIPHSPAGISKTATTPSIQSRPTVNASSGKAVVATRPSAAYHDTTKSRPPTSVRPVANEENSKKVYHVYRQIDPLPLDQTYNFKPVARAPIPIIEVYADDEDWEEDASPSILLPASSTGAGGPTRRAEFTAASKSRSISMSKPQSMVTSSEMTRRSPLHITPTLVVPKANGSSLKASTAASPDTLASSKADNLPRWSSPSYTENSLHGPSLDAMIPNPIERSSVSTQSSMPLQSDVPLACEQAKTKIPSMLKRSKSRVIDLQAPEFVKGEGLEGNAHNSSQQAVTSMMSVMVTPDQEKFSRRQRNLAQEAIPPSKQAIWTKGGKTRDINESGAPDSSVLSTNHTVVSQSAVSVTKSSEKSRSSVDMSDDENHSLKITMKTEEKTDFASEMIDSDHGNGNDVDCILVADVDKTRAVDASKTESFGGQNFSEKCSTQMDSIQLDQEFTKVRTIPKQIDPLPIDETFGPKGTIVARRAAAHAMSVLLTSDQDKSSSKYTRASHNAPDGVLAKQLAAIPGIHSQGRYEKKTSPTNKARRVMTQLQATSQQIQDNPTSQN